MNKLMGFYELKNMQLPSIPWAEYTGNEPFSEQLLWTVRSAVFHGDDLNLPRIVGVTAKEAKMFADELLTVLAGKGIVVYYPYFSAVKSGTLDVHKNSVIIEAVEKDLWNLVTYAKRDVTIQTDGNGEHVDGNEHFLNFKEKEKLLSFIPEIRKIFRDELTEGKSILFEWSFARDCDLNKVPIGNEYLVFYEARTV